MYLRLIQIFDLILLSQDQGEGEERVKTTKKYKKREFKMEKALFFKSP